MTDQLPQVIEQRPQANLSRAERAVSVAAGAALVLNGVRQGGVLGLAQLVAGAGAAWRGYSGNCQVKQALAARKAQARQLRSPATRVISRSVSIDRPLDEVFAYCREPANLGALIPWIDEIEEVADGTYEWRAHGPLQQVLRCTQVRSVSRSAQRLRWTSSWQGAWDHDVVADFAEGKDDQTTLIRVMVACKAPAGAAGHALAALLGKFADKALLNLLRSLKAQLETGQVTPQTMGGEPEHDFLFVHPVRDDLTPEEKPLLVDVPRH